MPRRQEQNLDDSTARIDPNAIPEIEPTRAAQVGRTVTPDNETIPLSPVQATFVANDAQFAMPDSSDGADVQSALPTAETVRFDPIGPRSDASASSNVPGAETGGYSASAAAPPPYAQRQGDDPATSQAASGARLASQKKPAKKNTRRKVIAAVAIVAVLAIAAVGGYYYWFTHSLDTSLDTRTDSEVVTQLVEVDESKPFYMLLLGSDVRISAEDAEKAGTWGEGQLTDVMLLTRIDATKHVVTFVSIPRDTPYELDDGTIVKINELYALGGAAKSVEGVSKVTGADIAHYAEVHIAELEEIVDAIGGVDVDVDQRLSYEDAITGEEVTLQPGEQHINGQQAQIFARVRKDYEEDQEEHRQSNVRQLMMAILDKVLDRPVLEIPGMVVQLAKYVGTDMTSADLTTLAMAFQSSDEEMTVYEATGPANGDINDDADGQWLCFENPEGWKALMERVDAGEDPSGIDYEATEIPWPPHVEEEGE